MIAIKMKHPVQAPKPGDAGGGLNIVEDSTDDGDDTAPGGATTVDMDPDAPPGPDEDRGDFVPPDKTLSLAALKAVAGEDTAAGAAVDDTLTGAQDTLAGGDDTAGGSAHVPIGRFNQVNEQKKALERQVAELQKNGVAPVATPAPTPSPTPFDVDATELKYAKLLADGDFEEAVGLRKQINEHLKQQAKNELRQEDEAQSNEAGLQAAAAQAIKDFPYLNTEDGGVAMTAIVALRNRFIGDGMSWGDALTEAVAKVAPKFAPEGQQAPGKAGVPAAPAPQNRTTTALARGAQASTAQPPALGQGAGTGTRQGGDEVDADELTEEQFDKLPEAKKKAMRGDVL